MSDFSLTEINEKISKTSVFVDELKKSMAQVVVGQDVLINKILIEMLANVQIIIEKSARFLLPSSNNLLCFKITV